MKITNFLMYTRWSFLALGGLSAVLLHVLLLPVLPLFLRSSWFPQCLSWFQTPDNPAIGDQAFQDNQMPWTKRLPGWLARYFLCIGWGFRNPAYGYDTWAGVKYTRLGTYASSGNEKIDVFRSATGECTVIEGTVLRRAVISGKHYFQYTRLFRYSFFPSRAYRISIGWSITPYRLWYQHTAPLNVSVNPWIDCRDGTV